MLTGVEIAAIWLMLRKTLSPGRGFAAASPGRMRLAPALAAFIAVSSLGHGCGAERAGRIAVIPRPATARPLAVVLSTDCGVEVDDQWALTHIALSPELQLRAVLTTHASSIHFSSATSAARAADVLTRVRAVQSAS